MAIIGALALIILGPERLPTAARTVGLFVGKARRMITSAKADLKRELEEHDVYNEVNKVRQDVSEASRGIKEGLKEKDIGGIQSVKRDLEDAVNEIKSSGEQSEHVDQAHDQSYNQPEPTDNSQSEHKENNISENSKLPDDKPQ